MQTCCLRRYHRCDELNEFWLCLQFVKFEGRLRPFVKLMKTVSSSSNSSNSLFKLKGGKVQLFYICPNCPNFCPNGSDGLYFRLTD